MIPKSQLAEARKAKKKESEDHLRIQVREYLNSVFTTYLLTSKIPDPELTVGQIFSYGLIRGGLSPFEAIVLCGEIINEELTAAGYTYTITKGPSEWGPNDLIFTLDLKDL